MAQKTIDEYGFSKTSVDFQCRKLTAYQIVEDGSYTYITFGDYEVGPIHRIDKSVAGTTKIEWTYGAVADRASLTYIPINDTMNIEV